MADASKLICWDATQHPPATNGANTNCIHCPVPLNPPQPKSAQISVDPTPALRHQRQAAHLIAPAMGLHLHRNTRSETAQAYCLLTNLEPHHQQPPEMCELSRPLLSLDRRHKSHLIIAQDYCLLRHFPPDSRTPSATQRLLDVAPWQARFKRTPPALCPVAHDGRCFETHLLGRDSAPACNQWSKYQLHPLSRSTEPTSTKIGTDFCRSNAGVAASAPGRPLDRTRYGPPSAPQHAFRNCAGLLSFDEPRTTPPAATGNVRTVTPASVS